MAEYTAFPLLQRLEATLTMSLPHCSGILEVPHEAFKLYYGGNEARGTRTCVRARQGEETVLDETYRKAGNLKMDSDNFMNGLDLDVIGLRDAVGLGLLSAKDETRVVCAELYRLNVCGEGAFFKLHKDTPCGQSMFGSLVVVFPIPHKGGTLILRHEDEEFTLDAAALLEERTSSIPYVAFFSDVEHEFAPVVSGNHVTLKYNIYYEERLGRSLVPAIPSNIEVLQPLHANVSRELSPKDTLD